MPTRPARTLEIATPECHLGAEGIIDNMAEPKRSAPIPLNPPAAGGIAARAMGARGAV